MLKYFMNPKDQSGVEVKNNNLTVISNINKWQGIRSNLPINNVYSKVYMEVTVNNFNANNSIIALTTKSSSLIDYNTKYKYWSDGSGYGTKWQVGDVISVLYDKEKNNGTLEFWKNGVSLGEKANNLNAEGDLYLTLIVYKGENVQVLTVNFGAEIFKYKMPKEYKQLQIPYKTLFLVRDREKVYDDNGQVGAYPLSEDVFKEYGLEDIEDLFNEDGSNIRLKKNQMLENGIVYSGKVDKKDWENIESIRSSI
ncbi:MAG TPA: hypothetical protein DCL31_18230 [Clostridium sp.]|nr:hypothetical protein [Clostridium sp.]